MSLLRLVALLMLMATVLPQKSEAANTTDRWQMKASSDGSSFGIYKNDFPYWILTDKGYVGSLPLDPFDNTRAAYLRLEENTWWSAEDQGLTTIDGRDTLTIAFRIKPTPSSTTSDTRAVMMKGSADPVWQIQTRGGST